MSQRSTRIRWNQEERNTILAAYHKLHVQDPERSVGELFVAAQKALPPQRRRALDYQLRRWLDDENQRARGPKRASAASPSAATGSRTAAPTNGRKRGKEALLAAAATAPIAPATLAAEPSRPRGLRAAKSALPNSAAIAKVLVELGTEIVVEILESARVQQALGALLRSAGLTAAPNAPMPPPVAAAAVPPTAAVPGTPEPGAMDAPVPAQGRLRVLIAGMEQREGAALAKTYDDTLDLACWSAADGADLLPEAVARADVVVGMTGLLSQPVEQTLRRHAKRYLRNARGVSGLRNELAGLALSGNGRGSG